MKKDFDGWNKVKKSLHQSAERPAYYYSREIWWCSTGTNIGNELDGKGERHDRPILIVRRFNVETFFGVCLIGHERKGKYYFSVGKVDHRDAVANLSQVRLYDSRRLIRKIGTLDEATFKRFQKALSGVLFGNNLPPFGGEAEANM